jgi:hypothetical protein
MKGEGGAGSSGAATLLEVDAEETDVTGGLLAHPTMTRKRRAEYFNEHLSGLETIPFRNRNFVPHF